MTAEVFFDLFHQYGLILICAAVSYTHLPYGRFDIDDEDSLSARLDACGAPALVDIAVVRLPRLSNFTDFSPLERIEGVGVRCLLYTSRCV